MKNVAIIPARGGSVRLPGKNITDFRGKPIIAYTIEAAIDSGCFDLIAVSTEDTEIAEISAGFGAEVDARPSNLATGDAHLVDVVIDFLDRQAAGGHEFDNFCMLHATAPLRRAEDIQAVMGLIEPGRCDFAAALTEFNIPAHQALKLDDDGSITPFLPDQVHIQSHDLPRLVAGNGSTYAAHIPAFREQRNFFGRPMRGHMMPLMRSVDIDTAEELAICNLFADYLDKAES